MSVRKRVIIIGGGVAGLSAAHELINRNFEVIVYETKTIPGGKARSIPVSGSGKDGRKDLPGEHGFRFFPRFYKHITSTLKEIPFELTGKSVYDNLTETSKIQMARFDKAPVLLPARFPKSVEEFVEILDDVLDANLGLSKEEKKLFAEKIWQILTSCEERRQHEYERISWWEFLDADNQSAIYQSLFARGLTRTLVAARAEEASTKTGGDILVQLLFDIIKPGISSDRVLCGPTNEVWIEPWLKHMRSNGLQYMMNAKALKVNCKENQIADVTIEENGNISYVKGDYYLFAVPVEVMSSLLNDDLLRIDPSLGCIKELSKNVSWMNGTQLYLKEDIVSIPGHTIYVDSPWAITSIYQCKFWNNFDISKHGDGLVKGILSVDISDWNTPGIVYNKIAKECSKEEIIGEVWAQLKRSLNVNGKVVLKDEYLHDWFIDPDIIFDIPKRNEEPLLINTINSWDLRPYAYTRVKNMYLASDYVKTNTDLATMEGANEAAKRAVNCILDAEERTDERCRIYAMEEPVVFSILRWKDKQRYNKGMPWKKDFPLIIKVIFKIRFWLHQKIGY